MSGIELMPKWLGNILLEHGDSLVEPDGEIEEGEEVVGVMDELEKRIFSAYSNLIDYYNESNAEELVAIQAEDSKTKAQEMTVALAQASVRQRDEAELLNQLLWTTAKQNHGVYETKEEGHFRLGFRKGFTVVRKPVDREEFLHTGLVIALGDFFDMMPDTGNRH